MGARLNKLPIYRGVACVELRVPEGARWWYAPPGLGYAPVRAEDLRDLQLAFVPGLGRRRLVAHVPGRVEWVAVNVARTDVPRLLQLGRWRAEFPAPPFDEVRYSAWPTPSL